MNIDYETIDEDIAREGAAAIYERYIKKMDTALAIAQRKGVDRDYTSAPMRLYIKYNTIALFVLEKRLFR